MYMPHSSYHNRVGRISLSINTFSIYSLTQTEFHCHTFQTNILCDFSKTITYPIHMYCDDYISSLHDFIIYLMEVSWLWHKKVAKATLFTKCIFDILLLKLKKFILLFALFLSCHTRELVLIVSLVVQRCKGGNTGFALTMWSLDLS